MSRSRTTSRPARSVRQSGPARGAARAAAIAGLGVLTAVGLAVATAGESIAEAAPPTTGGPADEVRLVLTDVAGTRVGRGAGSATVAATVRNAGTVTATGVQATYRLPAGLVADLAGSSPGCAVDADEVRCPLGTLVPGDAAGVSVAISEPDPAAVLGDRTGTFLAPTSDQFDPGAGEVRRTTWLREAGAEGTPLATCWPITSPAPVMDVAGGTCDGTVDASAPSPDEVEVTTGFPAPFAASMVRSDQFDTEFTAPVSGDYVVCAMQFDDGGYVAVTPAGTPFTESSVRVVLDGYGSATSAGFPLVGGARYRLMARVSNRGPDGVDNGATGGAMSGWGGVGVAAADQGCGMGDVVALGSGPVAWRTVDLAGVTVAPSVDFGVAGAIVGAPVEGARLVSARIRNGGRDPDGAVLDVSLPPGAVPLDPAAPCTVRGAPTTAPSTTAPSTSTTTSSTTTSSTTTASPATTAPIAAAAAGVVRCTFDADAGGEQVVSARVTSDGSPVPTFSWVVRGAAGVDPRPADDRVGGAPPTS